MHQLLNVDSTIIPEIERKAYDGKILTRRRPDRAYAAVQHLIRQRTALYQVLVVISQGSVKDTTENQKALVLHDDKKLTSRSRVNSFWRYKH